MSQTKLDRLRARGSVLIDADRDGYHVSWWPKGQKGNPLCGRGDSGPTLEPIIEALEEATRPMSRDWEDARFAREWQAQRDAEDNQRFWMRTYDREDRDREKRARHRSEDQARRNAAWRKREIERVRRVLT